MSHFAVIVEDRVRALDSSLELMKTLKYFLVASRKLTELLENTAAMELTKLYIWTKALVIYDLP